MCNHLVSVYEHVESPGGLREPLLELGELAREALLLHAGELVVVHPVWCQNSIQAEVDEDEVVTGSVSATSSAKDITRLVALHDAMGPERHLSPSAIAAPMQNRSPAGEHTHGG